MKIPRSNLCCWSCGRAAARHSGICDFCWKDRVALFATRKAKETKRPKRVISEATKEKMKAGKKAISDAKMA